MRICRSSTGHTCVKKKRASTRWQGNVARVQGAGMGISSSRFLPTSKPANDAADGRQINVLMAAMLQMPSVLECARPGRCMSPGHAAPARDLGPIMLAAYGRNDGGCADGEHYGTLITANDGRT